MASGSFPVEQLADVRTCILEIKAPLQNGTKLPFEINPTWKGNK